MLGLQVATTQPGQAVVYCQYVSYPHGCVVRAGVVLRPRPVARAAVRHNAGVQRKWRRQSRRGAAVKHLFAGRDLAGGRQAGSEVRDPFTFVSSAILLFSGFDGSLLHREPATAFNVVDASG